MPAPLQSSAPYQARPYGSGESSPLIFRFVKRRYEYIVACPKREPSCALLFPQSLTHCLRVF
jgi:hypothetical protein